MAFFEIYADKVIEFEGGDKLVLDPDDPGGATKFGIAQRYHPGVDVTKLTLNGARAIYKTNYWDKLKCSQFEPDNPGLAFLAFDVAINPGPSWASVNLQKALGVDPDGQIGQKTIGAARRADADAILRLTALRLEAYEDRVRANPIKKKYADGWRNRSLRAFGQAILFSHL